MNPFSVDPILPSKGVSVPFLPVYASGYLSSKEVSDVASSIDNDPRVKIADTALQVERTLSSSDTLPGSSIGVQKGSSLLLSNLNMGSSFNIAKASDELDNSGELAELQVALAPILKGEKIDTVQALRYNDRLNSGPGNPFSDILLQTKVGVGGALVGPALDLNPAKIQMVEQNLLLQSSAAFLAEVTSLKLLRMVRRLKPRADRCKERLQSKSVFPFSLSHMDQTPEMPPESKILFA